MQLCHTSHLIDVALKWWLRSKDVSFCYMPVASTPLSSFLFLVILTLHCFSLPHTLVSLQIQPRPTALQQPWPSLLTFACLTLHPSLPDLWTSAWPLFWYVCMFGLPAWFFWLFLTKSKHKLLPNLVIRIVQYTYFFNCLFCWGTLRLLFKELWPFHYCKD